MKIVFSVCLAAAVTEAALTPSSEWLRQAPPRQPHSVSQHQACVCEHLCFIPIYFVRPLAKRPKVIASSLYLISAFKKGPLGMLCFQTAENPVFTSHVGTGHRDNKAFNELLSVMMLKPLQNSPNFAFWESCRSFSVCRQHHLFHLSVHL